MKYLMQGRVEYEHSFITLDIIVLVVNYMGVILRADSEMI